MLREEGAPVTAVAPQERKNRALDMTLIRLKSALTALILVVLTAPLTASEQPSWRAGTARAIITPTEQMWMAGFAARTNPAEGKLTELGLKALALEDASGHRAVLVTTD